MDRSPPHTPALRLVNSGVASRHHRGAAARRTAGRPGSIDRQRPTIAISATDPRWVLAVRTQTKLQGGTAAILRPEDRRALLRTAEAIGLRAFDANLVIALVQDAARRGESFQGALSERLLMVQRRAGPRRSREAEMASLASSVALGVAIAVAAAMWVASG